MYGTRIIVPQSKKTEIIDKILSDHQGIKNPDNKPVNQSGGQDCPTK